MLTGTIRTNTTSSFTSELDDAFAQLFGESFGQSENASGQYDFLKSFEITLEELLSDLAETTAIERELKFEPDGTIELNFSGSTRRRDTWNPEYDIPVHDRWVDEAGFVHQTIGKY